MPKRADARQSQESILRAAEVLIKRKGAAGVTVEAVAREAGCAKGLVHYHYKTKRGLVEAVASHLAKRREVAWADAFHASAPKAAIDGTWHLLTEESDDGTIRAWASMFGPGNVLPDHVVNQVVTRFGAALGDAAHRMLGELDLEPTVPPSEIGWLLAAVVHGMGLQLLSGADRKELEGAYAAAWLGVLSLASPRT